MARLEAPEGANPNFAVPPSVSTAALPSKSPSLRERVLGLVACEKRRAERQETGHAECISEEEFTWMEARRSLSVTQESLALDYGEEALLMEAAFVEKGFTHLLGTLNWPGVGSRWRDFLEWLCKQPSTPATPSEALRSYGRSLGRIITYRALAIDGKALQRIVDADCIFPSGQLRCGSASLEEVVTKKGVRTVCVARLFISHLHRLLGVDPSISLHDDWQTTSLIASGYACFDKLDSARSRKVHLFELSCPKVESIGWSLQEVAVQSGAVLGGDSSRHQPWFSFPAPAFPDGIWIDGRLQRTERYGLYGVPFLSQRLRRLYVFQSNEELSRAIQPFAVRQAELHALDS